MPTPLARKIRRIIALNGPIGVSDYFSLCLADPDYGYYRRRDPFGVAGDFVTAPEVSQLFGELVGVFLVSAWEAFAQPQGVRIVEIGPGRGTMMADILRTLARAAPRLLASSSVHVVETSERLAGLQERTLAGLHHDIRWHQSFAEIPSGFTLLAANEFFDAVPIRQFIKTPTGFRERVVGVDADDRLAFRAGPATLDRGLLAGLPGEVESGSVFEFAPARAAIMAALAARLVAEGGAALAIDYGHRVTGYGDTLQAVRGHRYDDPLAHPGEADLTSHVDFMALAEAARDEGAHVHGIMAQGDFLLGLGLLERAGRLGHGKSEAEQEAIRVAVERLAAPGEGNMGELFKVMAVSGRKVALPPFVRPTAAGED